MSNKLVITGILGIALAAPALYLYAPVVSANVKLHACADLREDGEQIECIFRVIESEMERGGVDPAMRVFSKAYDDFHSFASTGCHRYAHRVGDLVYYHQYLGSDGIESIEFPQSTTACGYGFYHGFLEHLIQDNPYPDFVTKTCVYLTGRLQSDMSDIAIICYHGSGHGFELAESERVPRSRWGNLHAFVDGPLARCGEMSEATAREIEECRQGVFNVIVDWMAEKQYGFTYNAARPFAPCDALPTAYVYACYYEMAQKLDSVSGLDPVVIARIAESAPTTALADVAFRVGVAGIIQQTIADGKGYEASLARCATLQRLFFEGCIASMISGLFEHGPPQREYEKPFELCAESVVADAGMSKECYTAIAFRLKRFYEPARVNDLCKKIPEDFRGPCEE